MRISLFTTLLFGLFIMACGEPTSTPAGDMKDMAKNKSFQDKHEEPTPVTFTPQGEMITFDTPDGQKGSGYSLPAESTSSDYLFVFHEWWGLNDNIKQEAERYFESLGKSVNVIALDLYDGKVGTTREEASSIMQSVDDERAKNIIRGAMAMAGTEAKISTIGWCFGGSWSLKGSILAGEQGEACVMYYGMPVKSAQDLVPLKAEILGLFAEKDKYITPKVVDEFEALAKATGKTIATHQFDADHAFANPSSPRYNDEAAQKANALALDFLKGQME